MQELGHKTGKKAPNPGNTRATSTSLPASKGETHMRPCRQKGGIYSHVPPVTNGLSTSTLTFTFINTHFYSYILNLHIYTHYRMYICMCRCSMYVCASEVHSFGLNGFPYYQGERDCPSSRSSQLTIAHLGWKRISLLPASTYMVTNLSFKPCGNTTNCQNDAAFADDGDHVRA